MKGPIRLRSSNPEEPFFLAERDQSLYYFYRCMYLEAQVESLQERIREMEGAE